MPKLNKTMAVLARQGRLPPPPQSIMQYAKSLVDLEMMGPVATAAKMYLGKQGFNSMLAQLGEIENVTKEAPQLFQAIMEGFNPDEWRKFLVMSNSAPQKLLLDEKQLALVRQQKAAILKQKQQDERMMMLAKAAREGGQAPEAGSPTAQHMGGQ